MGDCCSKEEHKFDRFNNLNDSRHVMLMKQPEASEEFPIQSGYVPRKKHISKEKRLKLAQAAYKSGS